MTKKMIPVERRQLILNYLKQHGVAKSTTLIDLLESSEATIRRDMEWLEKHNLIERTHGGAILIQSMPHEAIYSASASINQQEKKWVARAAVQLLESGDMVFLNNGTTTTEVMIAIINDPDLKDITVVTNNVSAAMAAQDAEIKIILLGGLFRSRSTSLVGDFASKNLHQVYANKAILGMDSIASHFGCTSPISEEAEISRLMIDQCLGQKAIVIDHSKWGKVSQYHIAAIDEFDFLISDDKLPQEALELLDGKDTQVILAGPDLPSSK